MQKHCIFMHRSVVRFWAIWLFITCCFRLVERKLPEYSFILCFIISPIFFILKIVDNDPHFTIHLPKSNMDICFNIDSKPGHILNLISDPGTGNLTSSITWKNWSPLCISYSLCVFPPCPGVTINGQLVGSKKMKNNKINTYFGTISMYSKTHGVQVIVGTNRIDLMEGKNNHSFSWGATVELALNGY